ncbi:MAG: serine/threonine protein kinase [Myxococcaceae bacterium]|nr:serine/threonine protein kinase [Myxococcaceae bacterium]
MRREALSTDAFSGTVLLAGSPAGTDATVPLDPFIGVELSSAYRIERVIGEGAMGCLYQASHLRIGRLFAVKVLHQPLAQRDDMRARFDREARVMSRIKSDHVVDVVDVTLAPDGRVCIVTELLEGCDLEQHLEARAGKLPVAEAVSWMRQCLRGLAAAHTLGVVHRDLKPSNLFLARDASGRSTLKVLDFGVAKHGGDAELTAAGTIMGTPAYMAPEQARGARLADVRSDLYAVGAVLYRLLTGHAPYEGEDVNGTLIRLMQEAPARPTALDRSIPAGLEAVIERAMARDPAQRFQTAEELDTALAAFDSGHHDGFGAVESRAARPGAAGRRDDVATLSRRARLVRPLAVGASVLLSLIAGFVVTCTLALLVDSLRKSPRLGETELLLVLIGGGVGLSAALVASLRALASAWRNAATVQALTRYFMRTGLSFLGTLGAVELAGTFVSTLLTHRPAATDPFYACLRVLLASAVSLVVFVRTRAQRTRDAAV